MTQPYESIVKGSEEVPEVGMLLRLEQELERQASQGLLQSALLERRSAMYAATSLKTGSESMATQCDIATGTTQELKGILAINFEVSLADGEEKLPCETWFSIIAVSGIDDRTRVMVKSLQWGQEPDADTALRPMQSRDEQEVIYRYSLGSGNAAAITHDPRSGTVSIGYTGDGVAALITPTKVSGIALDNRDWSVQPESITEISRLMPDMASTPPISNDTVVLPKIERVWPPDTTEATQEVIIMWPEGSDNPDKMSTIFMPRISPEITVPVTMYDTIRIPAQREAVDPDSMVGSAPIATGVLDETATQEIRKYDDDDPGNGGYRLPTRSADPDASSRRSTKAKKPTSHRKDRRGPGRFNRMVESVKGRFASGQGRHSRNSGHLAEV